MIPPIAPNIPFLLKTLHECVNLQFLYVVKKEKFDIRFSFNGGQATLTAPWERLTERLCLSSDLPGKPVIRTNGKEESFIVVRCDNADTSSEWMIAGPFCTSKMDPETLINLAADLGSQADLAALNEYYAHLPLVPKTRAYHLAILMCYLIFGEQLDVSDVTHEYIAGAREMKVQETSLNHYLSKHRQELQLHHTSDWPRQLINCIKEGNRSGLDEWLVTAQSVETGMTTTKGHLRNQRNLAICGIALATDAAINGGLHSEIAYTLSDLYIQQIEVSSHAGDIAQIVQRCYYDLVDRVRETKSLQYSKMINRCREYIFNHIYESPTLQELAQIANLHPEYLSRLFKKEVGVSLGTYIQQERIEEAKKLLLYTELSITEVCTRLNFNDQSHFIKSFKKHTGVTPKKFRQNATVPDNS